MDEEWRQNSPWRAIAPEAVLHNGKGFVYEVAEGVRHHAIRMLLVHAVRPGILRTCQKRKRNLIIRNYFKVAAFFQIVTFLCQPMIIHKQGAWAEKKI